MRKYLELEDVRYFITVGIISLIGFSIFIVLTKCFGFWWFASSIIACLFVEVPGFFYKKEWVFENTNRKKEKLQFFFSISHSIIYLLINTALMHQFVDVYKFEEVFVQATIIVTFILPNLDINKAIFPRTKNPVA